MLMINMWYFFNLNFYQYLATSTYDHHILLCLKGCGRSSTKNKTLTLNIQKLDFHSLDGFDYMCEFAYFWAMYFSIIYCLVNDSHAVIK